jgi:hypothetical protein
MKASPVVPRVVAVGVEGDQRADLPEDEWEEGAQVAEGLEDFRGVVVEVEVGVSREAEVEDGDSVLVWRPYITVVVCR